MDTALGLGRSYSYFAHSLSDAWLYITKGVYYETIEKVSRSDVDGPFTGWLPGYDRENRRAKC
jgi:hypothetical protein